MITNCPFHSIPSPGGSSIPYFPKRKEPHSLTGIYFILCDLEITNIPSIFQVTTPKEMKTEVEQCIYLHIKSNTNSDPVQDIPFKKW